MANNEKQDPTRQHNTERKQESLPDSASLAGSRGEPLLQELISGIDLMYEFARNVGKPLPDALVEDISKLLANSSAPEQEGDLERMATLKEQMEPIKEQKGTVNE